MFFFFIMIMFMVYLFIYLMKNVHPMVLGLMLSFYVILISLKMNFYYLNYWYSYMLYLCMIGGLMILFMYFMSIIINMKMVLTGKFFFNMFLNIFFLMILFKDMYMNINYDEFLMMINNNFYNYYNYMNLFLYIDYDKSLFLMIYLLFMMIVSVLICMTKLVPMRKIN